MAEWFKRDNGETIVSCPYDKHHQVYIHKLSKHLEKCRRNYRLKQIAKGRKPLYLVCQFNSWHRVLIPEILFHESRCMDGVYRMAVVDLIALCENAAQSGEIKLIELVDQIFGEQHKLWKDGIYEGQQPEKRIPFLAKTASTKSDRDRFPHLFKKLEEEIRGGQSQSSVGASSLLAQGIEGSQNQVDSANQSGQVEDDDEDWGKGSESRPSFNYMDNLRNPKRPLRNVFPPGLTKAQRRQWEKRNTEWIYRIAREEEEKRNREDAEEGN
ncbi:unnamed protein product [Orchesella dallaii]|uniref:CHHC U11-48K-type domain-containing protein n=1 Tax=Orchesella dallaii TaxID=48710 RepID=A0ABP1QNY7_9HEXA